mgnify:CR=1 FL=1
MIDSGVKEGVGKPCRFPVAEGSDPIRERWKTKGFPRHPSPMTVIFLPLKKEVTSIYATLYQVISNIASFEACQANTLCHAENLLPTSVLPHTRVPS